MPEFAQLLKGYRRFREAGYPSQRERYDRLVAEGQNPQLMIIGCSDSRVDPAQIFDVDPGEIFVVRNVAALVPPYEKTKGQHGVSAAVEFAVQMLKVKQVVVMGHGMCGGCQAALTQNFSDTSPGEGHFIHEWISLLNEPRNEVISKFGAEGPDAERQMEYAAVKQSIRNLRSFPWIGQKLESEELKLRGCFFSIAEGVLYVLDEDTGEFTPAT